MFRYRRNKQVARAASKMSTTSLSVHAGDFAITNSGIKAALRSPLGRMSGNYPWHHVPIGIAAMKLLVVGGGNGGASISKLLDRFHISPAEFDMFDEAIGVVWKSARIPEPVETRLETCDCLLRVLNQKPTVDISVTPSAQLELQLDNPWVDSVNQIAKWGQSIQEACPHKPAAYDLSRIPAMDDVELEQYVLAHT